MTDNTELKRTAEACVAAGEYLPGEAWEEDRSYCQAEVAFLEFAPVATPAAVLALIAENDRNQRMVLSACMSMGAIGESLGLDMDSDGDEMLGMVAELKAERDQLKAENEALKKRIDDLSPFKGAPFTGQDPKCLACGGYHYGMGGLPCPNMRVMAQADLPGARSGQIGAAMGKGERS